MKPTLLSLVLCAGVCVGAGSLAQERLERSQPVSTAEAKPRGEGEKATSSLDEVRIDVSFPGGKLREYVSALRQATQPFVINVMAPETLLNVRLGEVSLREVSIETAVKAVAWGLEPLGTVMVERIGPNTYGVTSTRRVPPGAEDASAATQIQVLSLKELTEALPGDPPSARVTLEPDVVLTAVRTALETGGGDAPELKYHSDSGLIIVRGTRDQINTASSVLDRMLADMRMRRKSLKETGAGQVDLEQLRGEAEKHTIRFRLLEENLARAQMEAQRIGQMREKGAAGDADYNSARANVDRAKADFESARIDSGMAQARLAAAEKRMQQVEGAGRQAWAGGEPDFPPGRVAILYSSQTLNGKELEAVGNAAKVLAEAFTGKEVAVRAERDTLRVTADQEGHRVFWRTMMAPGANKHSFSIRPGDEKPSR